MEPFWNGLGEGFGSFLGDFGWMLGFQKASNFEREVGSRKSGSRDAKGGVTGVWVVCLAALIMVFDQSIIVESLIVGH